MGCALKVLALAVALACNGCANSGRTRPVKHLDESIGYPPGSYRNRLSELTHVVQSLAHVVIAHGSSAELSAVTELPIWLPLDKPRRTREQARELALRVSRDARTGKADFASLALSFSNDRATAPHGGALGTTAALALPGAYLDALLHLAEGEVSRVFETRAGFHVIRRLPVPRGDVSFGMLVVKHDGALGSWRAGRKAPRTRQQALELARSIAVQAQASPDAFPALVERHGDEFGSNPGGDRGRWSLDEACFSPLALHAAAALPVGSVGDVLDTPLGFAIVRRQPLSEPAQVAASAIMIAHDEVDEPLEPARSKEQAQALAQQALALLANDPSNFDALRAEYCGGSQLCAARAWPKRRGHYGFDAVVEALGESEIARSALDTPLGFAILRREPDGAYPLEVVPVAHELPDVKPVSIEQLLERASSDEVATGFMMFAATAAEKLQLGAEERTRFLERAQEVSRALSEADATHRMHALANARAELAAVLGQERAPALQAIREQWLLELQGWQK
jgi:hypothetical protein